MNFNNNNRQFGLWKSVNYVLVQFVNHVGIDNGFAPTHIITMHFAKRLCYSFLFERGYAGNLPIKRPIRGYAGNLQIKRPIRGLPTAAAVAAMQVIYKSNVRFADWVKRHACGLPARQCYFGYTIM